MINDTKTEFGNIHDPTLNAIGLDASVLDQYIVTIGFTAGGWAIGGLIGTALDPAGGEIIGAIVGAIGGALVGEFLAYYSDLSIHGMVTNAQAAMDKGKCNAAFDCLANYANA